jgi:hypothetical protein
LFSEHEITRQSILLALHRFHSNECVTLATWATRTAIVPLDIALNDEWDGTEPPIP